MKAVVTVGTTSFAGLVSAALSSQVLSQLERLGITQLLVQHGTSPAPVDVSHPSISIETVAFTSDIEAIIGQSSLVISHAGAGTIISALRTPSTPPTLVIVPNPTLMDAHQSELADALSKREWALTCSCAELGDILAKVQCLDGRSDKNVPPYDPTKIQRIIARAVLLEN